MPIADRKVRAKDLPTYQILNFRASSLTRALYKGS